ncbi:Polyketide cyclase / dehydrase and lipid transport [Streptomyces sp. cf386]|uniref:SRPBCC family protein n=1 Tax=Streptomyces sp. cf386 TaxID=1761904 RepID=UPI0008833005|nr:SRPBCC family protein [Streptomyces sp. cf386]SDO02771.1 Polyketide cyclase / dehydrase and lipid transport [Streptomyces sp. cf386]
MFSHSASNSAVQQPRRARFGTAAVTVALAVTGVLASTIPTAQATPHSSASRCGGRGVDENAVIRYESDVLIKAPLSTIWKLQTDVERWPSWQPPVTTAERLDPGRLKAGSQFRWTTPAPATPTTPATTLTITSTVQELRRHNCILWSGPAIGEGLRIDEGVHLWTFRKVKGGVLVHTEETWTGDQVEADVPTATEALGGGLEAWLRDLKTTAESLARAQ